MINKFRYTTYTKSMYLDSKSKSWTKINHIRIKKIKQIISKYPKNFNKIIEMGSHDLYFITRIFNLLKKNNCSKYTFSDIYETNGILEFAKKNLTVLKKKFNDKIKFDIISTKGEELSSKTKNKYNSLFIFETLEHVDNELEVIKNINNILDDEGLAFVAVPKEFGLMFLFKELGRLLILGKTNHNIKEIFNGFIGNMKKVERVKGTHKGYDYRITKKMFNKNGFKLLEEYYYPNKFLAYGVIYVFKKVKNI